jgi:hypothetical protein
MVMPEPAKARRELLQSQARELQITPERRQFLKQQAEEIKRVRD